MINSELKQCVQVKLYINLKCGGVLCEKGTSVPALLQAVFQVICKSNYTGLPSCHFNDHAGPSSFFLNTLA